MHVWAYGNRSEGKLTTGVARSRARGIRPIKPCYATAMTIILRLLAWSLPRHRLCDARAGGTRPHVNLGRTASMRLPSCCSGSLSDWPIRATACPRRPSSSPSPAVIELLQFLAPAGMHGWRILWSTRWRIARLVAAAAFG